MALLMMRVNLRNQAATFNILYLVSRHLPKLLIRLLHWCVPNVLWLLVVTKSLQSVPVRI